MKKILKFSVVAVCFVAAMLVNVSINANKGAGDTSLLGFFSKANAVCETHDSPGDLDGRCIVLYPNAFTDWVNEGNCVYGYARWDEIPCRFM